MIWNKTTNSSWYQHLSPHHSNWRVGFRTNCTTKLSHPIIEIFPISAILANSWNAQPLRTSTIICMTIIFYTSTSLAFYLTTQLRISLLTHIITYVKVSIMTNFPVLFFVTCQKLLTECGIEVSYLNSDNTTLLVLFSNRFLITLLIEPNELL